MNTEQIKSSAAEAAFRHSWEDACAKSPLARQFHAEREAGNASVLAPKSKIIQRFYNVDHNAYLPGALPASVKELLGLTASAVLRCDDCITYHVIQAYRTGDPRKVIEEALEIALVVGGSILIPHLRRAYLLLDELYA